MTHTPSARSISATTEVLELASLLDHRIPTPDKARVLAWARQIERNRCERDDLLDAVQVFYDRPSSQPISVGDVIEGSRRIKRDRLDREADEQRERREQIADTKAAGEVEVLAAGMTFGPTVNRTERLVKAENALQCCTTKSEAQEAIREYFAAKREAKGLAS